jgi:hypothetical protein
MLMRIASPKKVGGMMHGGLQFLQVAYGIEKRGGQGSECEENGFDLN